MFWTIDVRGHYKKHSIDHVLPPGVGWEAIKHSEADHTTLMELG